MEALQEKLSNLLLKIHKKNKPYIPEFHNCKNYERQIQSFCKIQNQVFKDMLSTMERKYVHLSSEESKELAKTFRHLFLVLRQTKWKLELYTGDTTLLELEDELDNVNNYINYYTKDFNEEVEEYLQDLLQKYDEQKKKEGYGYSLVLTYENKSLTPQIKTILGYICVLINESTCMFDIKDNKVILTTKINNFLSSLFSLIQFALYLQFFDLYSYEKVKSNDIQKVLVAIVPQIKLNGVYHSKTII